MPQVVAAAIAAVTGYAATSTGVVIASNLLLYAGTTAASYFIQQANQPKQDIGTKLSAQSGGAVEQSIIAGEKETAGSLIYAGTWGQEDKTPNANYVRVFCLQDMPSSGFLSRIWTGGKKGTIDLDHVVYSDDFTTEYPADGSGYSGTGHSIGYPITSLDHNGGHYAFVKFLDGSQTAADPYLRAVFGGRDDRPWTASMVGRGRTLMIVTQHFTHLETNSEQSFAAVVQGMAFYDWRKDSTNGGSGSHRWGDASTYEYTANPVVILYNIMRGIYRGSTWLYGGFDWPARRFDNASWTAAANVCDENVSLAAGGTQKRYRMGAEINLSEAPLTVMDRILATCSGRLVESGGIYKLYAGGIGASVYSFTDDDVIITEPLNGKMFPSREDICNTITGSYCEPNNGGQMKAYKKRTNADYVSADDGETRSTEMSFDYVRDNRQAQQLAKHALNDNRRFMTKTIALPSIGRKLEPGDAVNWSNSARFGFTNKKFIFGDVTLSNNGVVLGVLREADATDADWSISDEEPYTVGVYGDIVPANQTIHITVSATAVKKGDGSDKDPAVKVTWPTDFDMVDCKWVRLQVRYSGVSDPDKYFSVDPVPFDEGKAVITKAIRLNEVYDVRAKIIPYSDRDTDWCDWEPVTANVGHGVSIGDVEDQAPGLLAQPTVLRRTTVIRDGRIITLYKIFFDDSNDRLSYDVYIVDNTTDDFTWRHAKASPITEELIPLHNYSIQVRAVSKTGIPGDLNVAPKTFTVPKKTAGDGNVPAPTGVSASGKKGGIVNVKWNNPRDETLPLADQLFDYQCAEVRYVTSSAQGPSGASNVVVGFFPGDSARITGLNGGDEIWVFVRFLDTTGNPGDWSPDPVSFSGKHAQVGKMQSVDIGDGEVKNTNIGTKAVQNGNIDDEAVDTGQIKPKAVKGSKIDDLAVDTTHLKDGSVKSGKIGDSEVKTDNIDTDAVREKKVKTNTIINKAIGRLKKSTFNRTNQGTTNISGMFSNPKHVNVSGIKKASIRNPNPSPIFVGFEVKAIFSVGGYIDNSAQRKINSGSFSLSLFDDTNNVSYPLGSLASTGKDGAKTKILRGSFFTTKIKAGTTDFLLKGKLTFKQDQGLSGSAVLIITSGTFTFIDWKR